MSLRLKLYLIAVGLVATGLLAFGIPSSLKEHWPDFIAWLVVSLISETMWSESITGGATLSMSSTASLATVVLWGREPAMWIAFLCTILGDLFVLKKPLVRASFNAFQIAITLWLAGSLFMLLGGPPGGLATTPGFVFGRATVSYLLLPVLGLFVAYIVINRSLVALAQSWSSGRGWFRVLRDDWLFPQRLLADMASFLLSPIMVISFLTIGYPGVVLFYAPMFMIYESDKRYVELQRAQEQMVLSAAVNAKGEVAAAIGHNLNNVLVAISLKAQMLLKEAERKTFDNTGRHAQVILDQSKRMGALVKGLQDYSRKEVHLEPTDMNAMIRETVEFVSPQKSRYDGVAWELRLAESLPTIVADSGQIQSVLINLFNNAADAMKEQTTRKAIAVTSEHEERNRSVRIVVTDTGSGIKPENLRRIFELRFTTKPDGHGFGLSTSYRVVMNHGGRITVESPPDSGARFTMTLPIKGPS